jgi:hypothetical protein
VSKPAKTDTDVCLTCKQPLPATIGGPGDTVLDRVNHDPVTRFVRDGDVVYCYRKTGARYVYLAGRDLGGISMRQALDYHRSMVAAIEDYLTPGQTP